MAIAASRSTRDRSAGVTLVEFLVALAVLSLALLLTAPALQTFVRRGQIEGVATTSESYVRLARLEAIRNGLPARVQVDVDRREIQAFLDADADGVRDDGERVLGFETLPATIAFASPDDVGIDSVDGFERADPQAWATLNPDGSAVAAGAFRFADGRGNYLELRIEPRTTGRTQVRKWDGSAWHTKGEGGTPWEWH